MALKSVLFYDVAKIKLNQLKVTIIAKIDKDKIIDKSSIFSSIVSSNLILSLFNFGIILSMIVPKNIIPTTKAKNKHGLRNIEIKIINIDIKILCDMTFLLLNID